MDDLRIALQHTITPDVTPDIRPDTWQEQYNSAVWQEPQALNQTGGISAMGDFDNYPGPRSHAKEYITTPLRHSHSVKRLAGLLKEAADAHHTYEATNGKDADWPTWYATYILGRF